MRPGWGTRHPDFARLLQAATPAASEETAWANGAVPLRISAYTTPVELPDELVVSVRCLVLVGDELVVCTNADSLSHPWPGGRRESGESYAQTACREVLEETGWLLDPASLQLLGWLHLEHQLPQPDDYPYPHPDFLQVVFVGRASQPAGGRNSAWTDTDGYELTSCLMSLDDAYAAVDGDPLSREFIALIRRRRR